MGCIINIRTFRKDDNILEFNIGDKYKYNFSNMDYTDLYSIYLNYYMSYDCVEDLKNELLVLNNKLDKLNLEYANKDLSLKYKRPFLSFNKIYSIIVLLSVLIVISFSKGNETITYENIILLTLLAFSSIYLIYSKIKLNLFRSAKVNLKKEYKTVLNDELRIKAINDCISIKDSFI